MSRMNAYRRVQQWMTMARQWHLVDANRQDLDELGRKIARHLKGEHKPFYEPLSDVGDYVVVKNCRHIAMHAFQWKQRDYFFDGQYPRSKTLIPAYKIHEADPCRLVFMCAYRFLRNKDAWRRMYIERLFLLPDDDIPDDLAIKIGAVMEQVQRVPRAYDDYSAVERSNFPRIVPPQPENIVTWHTLPGPP